MSNAFEYEEVMAAAMAFGTTETVDEVLERQERKHEEADQSRQRKQRGSKMTALNKRLGEAAKAPPPPPSGTAAPKNAEMDLLAQIRAAGHLVDTTQPGPSTE